MSDSNFYMTKDYSKMLLNLIFPINSGLTQSEILEKAIPIYKDELGCESVCFIDKENHAGEDFIIPEVLDSKFQNPEFFNKLFYEEHIGERFSFDHLNDFNYYAFQLTAFGWLILITEYQLSKLLLNNFQKPLIYLNNVLELAAKTKSSQRIEEKLNVHTELVNEILSGIIITNLDGSLFYLNKVAKKWTGIGDSNLKDYKIFDIEENFKDQDEQKWLDHVEELKQIDDLKVEGEIIHVETDQITFADVSLKYFSMDNQEFIIANLIDTTEKINSKNKLQEELELQDLLLKIAGNYLNINYERIEETVQQSLSEIGSYVNADRVYIFDYNFKTETCSNTFEWCASDISAEINNLQDIPIEFFPEWIEKHQKKEAFVIENVGELPDTGEQGLKAILSAQHIKSLITLPMFDGDHLMGFVGFDSVFQYKKYTTREIRLLSLFSHMLVNIQIRKQWENNFRTQRDRYRSLINDVNLGLIEVDKDFKIKFVNENFCKLLGYEAHELSDQNCLTTFFEPKVQSDLYDNLISLKEGENISLELSPFDKQKRKKPVFISICVLIDKFNNTKGYLGSLVDLEDQKAIEKNLKIAKDKAEIASKAKETFLANISHEMRTPLHIINGTLNEVLKTDLDSEQSYLLGRGNLASVHLLNLVNNILDIAKINSEEIHLNYRPDILYKTTNEVFNMLRPLAKDNQIDFNFHFNLDSKAKLIFDAQKLNQVLINLISNAIKFTKDGSVDFHVDAVKELTTFTILRFRIKDTGIGMTEEFQKDLFENFKREVDFGIINEHGTGLGMPISKRLISLMGSEIKVKSKKYKGSEFYFDLKFKKVLIDEDEKHDDQNFKNIAGKHILVVEDNLMSQFLISRKLKRQGALISKCDDGQEAIDILEKKSFDILLIDNQMPNLNGLETVKIIREKLNLNVPIVIITANVFSGDLNKFKRYTIEGFIYKPFKDDILFATLHKVLDTKSIISKPESSVKDSGKLYTRERFMEAADNDMQFLNELMETFQIIIDEALENMKLNMVLENQEALLRVLHKIKPSLIDLKLTDAVLKIRNIEKKDITTYHEASKDFEEIYSVLRKIKSEVKEFS